MKNLKFHTAGLIAVIAIACSACNQVPNPNAEFEPTASLQEVMNSIIDPNMDYVWNSVATISTQKGTEERSPKTDEDWLLVKQHALVVLEASNLLLIKGRPVAAVGANTSTTPAELSPAEIQKAIEANHDSYLAYAHALHASVTLILQAIEAKNVEKLNQFGGEVDRVCEACHKQFWYPHDTRPTSAKIN
jgi:hypothetical protein